MDTDRSHVSLPPASADVEGETREPGRRKAGSAIRWHARIPAPLPGDDCSRRKAGSAIRWHARVICAVVRQRWTSFARYPADLVSSMLSPILSLAAAILMSKAFSTSPQASTHCATAPGALSTHCATAQGTSSQSSVGTASDFRSFLLISSVLWTYIRSQLYLGFSLQSEMRLGTAEAVLQTPAPRWSYLTGQAFYQLLRSTLNVAATVIVGAACFGASGILGGPNWPRTLAILVLDLLVVYGYGLVLAGTFMVFRSGFFSYLWDCLLPLLAGSTFSVSVLPPLLRRISMVIPLTYGLDLLRWSVAGYPTILDPSLEAGILCASAILLPLCGYAGFAALERVAISRGTLGQF